ncbi:hypothetical protein FD754_002810, partial [Muntiacus muntjak]
RRAAQPHLAALLGVNTRFGELTTEGWIYLSSAKRKFADSLNEFKFQCIGDAETDDEMCIARSLQEFATVLRNLEDERIRMIENASEVLITPLEKFRKEQIGAAKEAKKKYDKETEKYCGILEKHLNLSSKKKESQLQEADSQVDLVRQHFYEVSLEYVFKVQEVQERKMFEFVEPLLAFLQGLFTFYHHGYELAKDFNDFKTQLTISIQNTRNRFEGTRSEVESLMKKMKENPLEHKTISPYTMEGYLYVQEKRHFGTSWVKHYCTYQRDSKQITMVPFDQKSGGKGGEDESVTLKSCTRRKTDSIEKRFCFDVEAVDRVWSEGTTWPVVQNKASESPLNKLGACENCSFLFPPQTYIVCLYARETLKVVGIKQQKGTQSQICTQGECLVNMKAEIRVVMLRIFISSILPLPFLIYYLMKQYESIGLSSLRKFLPSHPSMMDHFIPTFLQQQACSVSAASSFPPSPVAFLQRERERKKCLLPLPSILVRKWSPWIPGHRCSLLGEQMIMLATSLAQCLTHNKHSISLSCSWWATVCNVCTSRMQTSIVVSPSAPDDIVTCGGTLGWNSGRERQRRTNTDPGIVAWQSIDAQFGLNRGTLFEDCNSFVPSLLWWVVGTLWQVF